MAIIPGVAPEPTHHPQHDRQAGDDVIATPRLTPSSAPSARHLFPAWQRAPALGESATPVRTRDAEEKGSR